MPLDRIEQDGKVALRERARPFAAIGYLLGAAFVATGARYDWTVHQRFSSVWWTCLFAYLLICAFYNAVESTLQIERSPRALLVKRKLGMLKIEKRYAVSDISQVVEHRVGDRAHLALRLCSGKTKRLTLFRRGLAFTTEVKALTKMLGLQ
jgi:hypothetical protein